MTRAPADIVKSIREAGVVGAGGAGFPTHVKASARAQVVIVNAAECEPLLQKDQELLKASPEQVLAGLELLMAATGAKEGVLGIKAKHGSVIAALRPLLQKRPGMRLHELGDFYPAGDEFCLVYEVLGKAIPPGGIPLHIGAVVSNVETLYNVAAQGPVTDTWLTVAGAVRRPCTLCLPVGVSIAEALDLAGGPTCASPAVLDGGAMMGRVVGDLSEPLTKTSGGFIVLPGDHPLIRRKSSPRAQFSRIGRSACDQCSFCTEFCPRYLLGYAIEPHKVMRSLSFTGSGKELWSEWALLCCECSLCSLYACPESLDPKNVCVSAKGDLRAANLGWKESALAKGPARPAHPMREFRKVPIPMLIRRLGLEEYKAEAPLLKTDWSPRRVSIPLKQGLGAPAIPVVKTGDRVTRGQLLADLPADKLGARVHASIAGTVRAVDSAITIEA